MEQKLSDIVSVTVTRETKTVSQTGFGTAMVVGTSGRFAERTVREYADTDDMPADGFVSSDPEYKAVAALFAQSPRPNLVKVSQRATPVALVQTLTFSGDLIEGNKINLQVDDVPIAEITYGTSHNDTMAAIAAALQATTPIGTATCPGAGSRVITMTAAIAGVPFAVTAVAVTGGDTQATGVVATSVENVGITEDLAAISLADDDWYVLFETTRTPEVVKLAAAWAETQVKIFGTVSNDANIKEATLTDLAAVLKSKSYSRSFVCYNEAPSDWLDAGWVGRCIANAKPASLTWMFKLVVGPVASSLTRTERTNILSKNCNILVPRAGLFMMEEGTMAGGDFIDIICGQDWIVSRMQEAVFGVLANADKIPYTDQGAAIIEAQMRMVMERAMSRAEQILAPDPDSYNGQPYYVYVPKVKDQLKADRGNRVLRDCEFAGTYASAIHKVGIVGRLVL